MANISRRLEECYILEPLVIRGLSHSVNLGISFLTKHKLKLIFTKEEVALMPLKDGSGDVITLSVRGRGEC